MARPVESTDLAIHVKASVTESIATFVINSARLKATRGTES